MTQQENANMQDTERGAGATNGAAFAAKVAAMTPAEREGFFPNHSDGQVCR